MEKEEKFLYEVETNIDKEEIIKIDVNPILEILN